MNKLIAFFLKFIKNLFNKNTVIQTQAERENIKKLSVLPSVPSLEKISRQPIRKTRRKNNRKSTHSRKNQKIKNKFIKHF